jgi:thymidylate synthase (FAD)
MASGIRVSLINHTPEPERSVALAGRLCYAAISVEDLKKNLTQAEVNRLVKLFLSSGHWSAIEHTSFTFAVEGVSRVCTHQLVRHRLASYNQQSQRYVKFDDYDFVIPSTLVESGFEAKFAEQAAASFKLYREMVEAGVPAEDARYILPQAGETKIVITMNARELWHFFTLRCCRRAQWEIRKMACLMLLEAQKVAPILFEKAGSSCLRGPCPEGKFSCGKPAKSIQDILAEL